MKFLYPEFLYAMVAVIIPVIIHLFNFQRYKKVAFSNVAFLKEVKHSTKAKSNLKHLLIMASRMAMIAALVMAFAQPYIPVDKAAKATKGIPTSLFIDNSYSMESQIEQDRLIDIAREMGYLTLDQVPNFLDHQLLSTNFESAEQHLFSAQALKNRLGKLEIGPNSPSLDGILKRQKSAFEDEKFNGIIVSDFQKSQYILDEISWDSSNSYTLIPISPQTTNNLAFDTLWFNHPIHRVNQQEEIHFRIHNYGKEWAKDVRTELIVNDNQISFIYVNIPPQSYVDTFIVFSNDRLGWHQGYLQIDDSPIQFDNQFHFSFNISSEISVLAIRNSNSQGNIAKAFAVDPFFNFSEVDELQVDYSTIHSKQLIILNEVENYSTGMISSLTKYVNDGGHLVIIPPTTLKESNVNDLIQSLNLSSWTEINRDSTRVQSIDLESDLYTGVFSENQSQMNLPNVYQHFVSGSSINGIDLLTSENGDAILSQYEREKGTVYRFHIPFNPNYSNFSIHSIFLPTLFQMAFNSAHPYPAYAILNQTNFVEIPALNLSTEQIRIQNSEKNTDFIPEIIPNGNEWKLGIHRQIGEAGTYSITIADSLLGLVSMNNTTQESSTEYYSMEELQNYIDSIPLSNVRILEGDLNDFSTNLKKQSSGDELWRWFLILALIFLALEIVLIRYYKPSVI